MNIFAVNNDPLQAARDLPDKLVVKMPTESLQLLTPWAFNVHGVKIEKPDPDGQLVLLESERRYYGTKGFAHHPCAKWLYESPANVAWLLNHAWEMVREYGRRYGKVHGTTQGLDQIADLVYWHEPDLSWSEHTEFVQAMPEEFKVAGDAITAYRNYINGYKGYAEWRHSAKPAWWNEEMHEPVRKQYLAEREAKRVKRQHEKHSRLQTSLQN